jgi:hypothetical protein
MCELKRIRRNFILTLIIALSAYAIILYFFDSVSRYLIGYHVCGGLTLVKSCAENTMLKYAIDINFIFFIIFIIFNITVSKKVKKNEFLRASLFLALVYTLGLILISGNLLKTKSFGLNIMGFFIGPALYFLFFVRWISDFINKKLHF